MTTSPTSKLILCDAHVHIYDCFNLGRFLDSAWENFRDAALQHGSATPFSPVLLLTETIRDHWFSKLTEAARASQHLGTAWEFHLTGEPNSICAEDATGREILIVAGRQIITAENLEVLALFTAAERSDGDAIRDVVEWVLAVGGLPVVPWGFGKWWGRRGKILSQVLESFGPDQLLLGDNGGRPAFLGHPPQFSVAEREKRNILPGTDPLPFPSEAWRPGSVGFSYRAAIDTPTTAESIRKHLRDPGAELLPYMKRERLLPFIRNQIAMQWRKRTA